MDDGKLEIWFIEKYLNLPIRLPGSVQQSIFNFYVEFIHWFGLLIHRKRVFFNYAEEIAERSGELMEKHYDQPQELFENFLGESMKYSMGLWEPDVKTLEESQARMLDDICEKARIEDGQAILDIGCGFGSFVSHALKKYPNAKVHGLTLSKVQCDYMRELQNTPGHPLHTDRFHLIEGDFNTVQLKKTFDRIVSIGVFEHVSNLTKGLKTIRSMLSPEGLCLLHFIIFKEPLDRIPIRHAEDSFINKYIFPGGRIWFDKELFEHQQDLRIEKYWYINGYHYRKTLEGWLSNLLDNREKILAAGTVSAKTLKIWELYFRLCIGIFRCGKGEYYGNGQYLLRTQ